jgi:osmotically-inducible protein OsmY
MGRRGYSNSGSRIGGSNYGGGYSDRDRSYDYEGRDSNEWRNRDYNEGRGSGYTGYAGGPGYYGSPGYMGNTGSSRSYGRTNYNQGEERGFWDRASDEVASWFGDDDAERRRERDRQMRNSHKGKGPRNYSRSDERIKEDINDRLSDDPFVDASDIDVTVSNGEVTLTGTVDERSSKRRAEDLAESVSGVKNVENRIRVSTTSGTYGTGVTGMGSTGTSRSSSTMQNRESQSSESRSTDKDKQTTGTNSKKDFVTG